MQNSNQPAALDQTLDLKDFEFDLPAELIAQQPIEERHESRLLVIDRAKNTRSHLRFKDIKSFLKDGDIIVVNDTQVLPAKLYAKRKSGGVVKLLLIKPMATATNVWEAMVMPIKRLKVGDELEVEGANGRTFPIFVKDFVLGPDGYKRMLVDLGAKETVFDFLKEVGFAPLPPYIHRNKEESDMAARPPLGSRTEDIDRYQTVFAKNPGAVAAPTAGLHFSNELIEELRVAGIELHKVTLHVGPGTFKPISTSVDEHTIEAETYSISESVAQAVNDAKARGSRVVAVGTTSLRALESAGASGKLLAVENGSTNLYVKPGHDFRIVDSLITNFHLSASSLLILVAAYAGRDRVMEAYKEAVLERYRFYSYGDAMLIL